MLRRLENPPEFDVMGLEDIYPGVIIKTGVGPKS